MSHRSAKSPSSREPFPKRAVYEEEGEREEEEEGERWDVLTKGIGAHWELGADLGANRVEPCRFVATGGEPCG